MPVAVEMPTITPTARSVLPATWTPLPSPLPSARSRSPHLHTIPQLDAVQPVHAYRHVHQTLVVSGLPYAVAAGSPVAISSATFHPEAGCNWMGVAGQVLIAERRTGLHRRCNPAKRGFGEFVDITSLTGIAPQYGQSGYEFTLSDKPVASNNTLWVQLLDQAGLPLSEKAYFETFEDCGSNLIFLNFKQVR
jgi:hypothetical protein